MAQTSLELPEPMGIKPLEVDSTSIYLRWAILSNHGLSKHQLMDLDFEFKTNQLRADCTDNAPKHEYKARLCGLCPDTKYRFQIRSRLQLGSDEVIYSKWSNRIEVTTRANLAHFVIVSNEKELETESLKHRLRMYTDDNKKLRLQIEQLQLKLNESSMSQPGHWQWDSRKIVNWIIRIQDGICKPYKKQLLKSLKEEGIIGKDLNLMTEDDLRRWGITEFRPRKVVMQYIKGLTENDPKPDIEYDPTLTEQLSEPIQEEVKHKEEEHKEEEDKDKDNPMITRTSEIISASVEDLLYSHSVEKKKEWKYKEGMLSVTVIRARNVDNMDADDGAGAESDPYVELELKGNYRKEQTKSIQDEANPVWKEKFQLFVDDARNDVLKARLYDHDKWLRDDKIGEVQIPIITILGADGHLRKEFDVIGSKIGCTLELELKYWESLR